MKIPRGWNNMLYGLKDLAAPYIQFEGTLVECFRETRGFASFGIYRLDNDGWNPVQKRVMNWDRTFFVWRDGEYTEVSGFQCAMRYLREGVK